MAYHHRPNSRFDCGLIFRKIQILREGRPGGREPIGKGAYGAVYYAKCDSLLCAAKSIHAIFFDDDITDPVGRHHQLQAFHEEVELMASMRHPNIVQFLGYYDDSVYDPKTKQTTKVPCLLMELLDESLTRYLERVVGAAPLHTTIDFAHDISKALDYLHINGRIHCDLTSNNVLIIASTRAKVTDFGQSVLAKKENNYHVRGVMCPGNVNYMPPEARRDDPFFSPKIDVFSFGVLLIQILTRKFPEPQEPMVRVGNKTVPVKEVARRGNHIAMINSHHPLLELALYCLNDIEDDRPEFRWLTERLNELQRIPEYDESQRDNPGATPRPQLSTFNPDNDRRIKELLEKLHQLEDYNINLERHVAQLQHNSPHGRRFDCGLIFRKIQILREGRPGGREPIGTGAYGAVYYAKCDSLLCAAKSIHAIFFDDDITDPEGRQHQLQAFHKEVELMASMRHPNIVQFLGYYDDSVYDPKTKKTTKVPCLLMELLDESLTRYLERVVGAAPLHTTIDFAHDISKALDYLHINGRIHCDLTSNNVLIIASTRAKVTDFGQSVLAKKENNYHVRGVMCPGNVNYMPPEAKRDDPFFSPKIDVFSFGVLLIQILTRRFPEPQEPTMHVGKDKEVARRSNHIGMIDSHHPLLALARYCLNDREDDRPEFHWLTERLNELQRIPEYDESQRDNPGATPRPQLSTFNPDNDRRIKELMDKLNGLEDYNIDLERHVAQLQSENDSLKTRLRTGSSVGSYSLEQNPPAATHYPAPVRAPSYSNPSSFPPHSSLQNTTSTPPTSLTSSISANPLPVPEFKVNGKTFRWFPCSRLPAQLYSGTAVCIKDKIYVNGQGLNGVFELDPSRNMWSSLPVAPTASFALVGIRDTLTTVGGYTTQAYSDALYSLVSISGTHSWRATYPPMKEPRINAGAISTRDYLVVAGGEVQAPRSRFVSWNVEMMHIDTQQWMAVDKLPKPAKRISMASTGTHLYVVGGLTRNNQPLKEIYHVSLSNLVTSGTQGLSRALRSGTCWGSASIPVVYATCAVVNQQLLVLGGWDNQPSLAMYGMNINAQSGQIDSWSQIGKLPLARFDGMAAVLPGQRLVVIGGRGNVPGQAGEKVLDAAEMACPSE